MQPVKPVKKGKFGVILSDYKRKLESLQPKEEALPLQEDGKIVIQVDKVQILSHADDFKNLVGRRLVSNSNP